MGRVHELELQKRSLAIRTRGQMALNHERADAVVSECIDLHRRVNAFQEAVREVMRTRGVAGPMN